MIDNFREEYFFLSNMYPCLIFYKGVKFKCSESIYQALKTGWQPPEFTAYSEMNGWDAKQIAKTHKRVEGWNEIRVSIMYEILAAKFTQNREILQLLLETNQEEIIEGNTWHDYFWGQCNGVGENHLGRILMQIREEQKRMQWDNFFK